MRSKPPESWPVPLKKAITKSDVNSTPTTSAPIEDTPKSPEPEPEQVSTPVPEPEPEPELEPPVVADPQPETIIPDSQSQQQTPVPSSTVESTQPVVSSSVATTQSSTSGKDFVDSDDDDQQPTSTSSEKWVNPSVAIPTTSSPVASNRPAQLTSLFGSSTVQQISSPTEEQPMAIKTWGGGLKSTASGSLLLEQARRESESSGLQLTAAAARRRSSAAIGMNLNSQQTQEPLNTSIDASSPTSTAWPSMDQLNNSRDSMAQVVQESMQQSQLELERQREELRQGLEAKAAAEEAAKREREQLEKMRAQEQARLEALAAQRALQERMALEQQYAIQAKREAESARILAQQKEYAEAAEQRKTQAEENRKKRLLKARQEWKNKLLPMPWDSAILSTSLAANTSEL